MGAYLVPILSAMGYSVHVTSRKKRVSDDENVRYFNGDAKSNTYLKKILRQNYDVVVDFMLYTTDEFTERYEMLLQNCRQYIYLSSYRVYGESTVPLSESSARLLETCKDSRYLKTDEYALAKARQEDLLNQSKHKNWTVVRPAITYSKDRFFFGAADTDGFLYRAIKGSPLIFPKEILDKKTTMTWAGDAAEMIARLVGDKNAAGEVFNVSTDESHTWREVIELYKATLGVEVKIISLDKYIKVYGLRHMMLYNRMYDRIIDNKKILKSTEMDSKNLTLLSEGLPLELNQFLSAPKFNNINTKREAKIDMITTSTPLKLRRKASRLKAKVKDINPVESVKLASGGFLYEGAIVTLTVYNNYGNVLQRYALQKFLAENNYKYHMFNFHKGGVSKHHMQVKEFVDRYISQASFNPRLAGRYKAYIVGSDQVWRYFSVNKDWKNFGPQFLNFVKNNEAKKIAYAASFGVDSLQDAGIVGDRRGVISRLMGRFDAISVRESSAVGMVDELTGMNAVQTLDPTLLLSADIYEGLIEASKSSKDKSSAIFYYLIDPTPLIQSFIKQNELALEEEADGVLPYLSPYRGDDIPSVEYWLKGIRDAEIVITDSYHAVVFSLIFHTEFVIFDKKGGGIARITELLEPLGLADRIIVQGEKTEISNQFKPINWKKVDAVLAKSKKHSSEWLLRNLK